MRNAQDMVRSKGAASVTAVTSSPLIQRLREQETELRREEADLASRYGEKHPSRRNVKAEIADLSAKNFRGSGSNYCRTDKVRFQWRRRVKIPFAAQLAGVKGQVKGQTSARIKIGQLEQEADVNRKVYEEFLGRYQETLSQDILQRADARLIERADPPRYASYPRRKINVNYVGYGCSDIGLTAGLNFRIVQ